MQDVYDIELGSQMLNVAFDSSATAFVLTTGNRTGGKSPVNAVLIRGNALNIIFTVSSLSNQSIQLTLVSAIQAFFKNNVNDADLDAVFSKSLGSGITILNDKQFQITFSPSDTPGIAQTTRLFFDAMITDPSGNDRTVGLGSTLTVYLNVSG